MNSFQFYYWISSLLVWTFILNPSVKPIFTDVFSYDSNLLIFSLLFGFTISLIIILFGLFKIVTKRVMFFGIALLVLLVIVTFVLVNYTNGIKEDTEKWFLQASWHDLFLSLKDFGKAVWEFFYGKFLYVVMFHFTIVGAVYLNLRFFIPRFLNSRRFGIYLMNVAGLVVVAAFSNYSLFNFIVDPVFPGLFYISYFKVWELVFIVFFYLLFTTFVFLVWQYAATLISNEEKSRNELTALKAQINPHFLFNNLNTIYSMSERKDEHTGKVILQLSDFLRYVLYDTTADFIALEKEVEIITTYINLQKERINPELTKIDFKTEGNFEGQVISPLLLLPLAENCFKYSRGRGKGHIRINIRFDGNWLLFETENNIVIPDKPNGVNSSGLGIRNVTKRLELLYPGNYFFTHGETEGIYKLELKINLTT